MKREDSDRATDLGAFIAAGGVGGAIAFYIGTFLPDGSAQYMLLAAPTIGVSVRGAYKFGARRVRFLFVKWDLNRKLKSIRGQFERISSDPDIDKNLVTQVREKINYFEEKLLKHEVGPHTKVYGKCT